MTRIVLIFLLVTVSWQVFGQTILAERIEVKSGQKVSIDFAYANEVNVRGWDNNYISIKAKVLINMGKNDVSHHPCSFIDYFVLSADPFMGIARYSCPASHLASELIARISRY